MLEIKKIAFIDIEKRALRIQKITDLQRKESEIQELSSLITRTVSFGVNALEVSLCFGGNETAKLFLSSENFRKNYRPSDQRNPLFFYLSDDRVEEIDDKVFQLLLTDENLTEYNEEFNIINYLILAQDKLSNSNLIKVLKKLKTLEEQGKFDVYRSFLNNYVFFLFETYCSSDYNLKKIDLRNPASESIKLHKSNLEKLKILNQYFPLGEKTANFESRNDILFFIVSHPIQEVVDMILESDSKIDFYYNDKSQTIFHSLVLYRDSVNFIKFLKNLYESSEITNEEKNRILFFLTSNTNVTAFSMLMRSENDQLRDSVIAEANKQSIGFRNFFKRIFTDKIPTYQRIVAQFASISRRSNIDYQADLDITEKENYQIRQEKTPIFLKIFNSYSQELKKWLEIDDSEDLFVVATRKKNDYVALKLNDKIANSGKGKIFRDVFFGYFRELKAQQFLAQSCFFVNFSFDEVAHRSLIEKAFSDIKRNFQERLLSHEKSQEESLEIKDLLLELARINSAIANCNDKIEKLKKIKAGFESKGRDIAKQIQDIKNSTSQLESLLEEKNTITERLNKFGYENIFSNSKTSDKEELELLQSPRKSQASFELGFAKHTEQPKPIELGFAKHTEQPQPNKDARSESFRDTFDPVKKHDPADQSGSSAEFTPAKVAFEPLVLINPRTQYGEVLTGNLRIALSAQVANVGKFKISSLSQFSRACLLVINPINFDFSAFDQEIADEKFKEKFKDFCETNPRRQNYSNKLKFLFHHKFDIIKEKICDYGKDPGEVKDLLYMFLAHCHQASREALLKLFENPAINVGVGHASGADIFTLQKSIFALDSFSKIIDQQSNGDKAFGFLKSIQADIINPSIKTASQITQSVIFYQDITIDGYEYFQRLIEEFSQQKKFDVFYEEAKNKTREFCQGYANLLVSLFDEGLKDSSRKIIPLEFNQQIELFRKLSEGIEVIDNDKFFKILNDNPELLNLIYDVSNDQDLQGPKVENEQLAIFKRISKTFARQDSDPSLLVADFEDYQAILTEVQLPSFNSLKQNNIRIFEKSEENFVTKSRAKEYLNSSKYLQ